MSDWKEDERRIFDEFASKGHGYVYSEKSIRDLDRIIPEGKILDIGCGTGYFHEKIKRDWYGVDISEKSIERVKNGKVGDITKKIPFASNLFDVVTSVSILHHLPTEEEIRMALKECHRVLKPDGKIIIIEHDNKSFRASMAHDSIFRVVPSKYERTLNYENTKKLCEEEGFDFVRNGRITLDAKQSVYPPLIKRIWKIPANLMAAVLDKLFGREDCFILIMKKGEKK